MVRPPPATVADRAAAFDQAPWPALVIAGDGLVVAGNDAAEALFGSGFSRKTTALAGLIPSGAALARLVERVQAGGAPLREAAFELAWPDRPAIEAEAAATPLAGDQVLVTLHLPMESSMGPAAQMLPAAAGLGRTLAHEIKNPLAGIRGAAQLLRGEAEGSDAALAQLIMDETDRIRRLVDQVEMLSDERSPPKRRVNLHRILERVRALVLAASPGIVVRERYDPSLPHAGGDEDQLVQVFLNLAKNAAEALAVREDGVPCGEILLATAYRHGARVRAPTGDAWRPTPLEVRIEDDGPGVPAEVRGRLFDPFVTAKPMGTGLGLTIAAKLVSAHGGALDFHSEPGRTVFRVLLPVGDAADPGHDAPLSSKGRSPR